MTTSKPHAPDQVEPEQDLARQTILRVLLWSSFSVILFWIIRILRQYNWIDEFRWEDFAIPVVVLTVSVPPVLLLAIKSLLHRAPRSPNRTTHGSGTFTALLGRIFNFRSAPALFIWALLIFGLTLSLGRVTKSLSSSRFAPKDFRATESIQLRLLQDTNPLPAFLLSHLSSSTRTALVAHPLPLPNEHSLRELLAQDFSRIVESHNLSQAELIEGVRLRSKTRELLAAPSVDDNFASANRMIVEDAFPQEISKRQSMLGSMTGESDKNSNFISSFIEWFGVPYGLIVAALLVQAWLANGRIYEKLDDEHDHIDQLTGLLEGVSQHNGFTQRKTDIEEIISSIAVYYYWVRYCLRGEVANAACLSQDLNLETTVMEKPWKREDAKQFQKIGTSLLKGTQQKVHNFLFSADEPTKHVAETVFGHFEALYDARGNRIDATNGHIDSLLNLLLGFSTFIWLTPFWLLSTNDNIALPLSLGGAWAATIAGYGIVELLQHYQQWPRQSDQLKEIFLDNEVLSVKRGRTLDRTAITALLEQLQPVKLSDSTTPGELPGISTQRTILNSFVEFWVSKSAHGSV